MRGPMEDLLKEFLTETNESLDVVDVELVRFEQDPNNAEILGNIFRLVHTIKGTCGFIGLPRLEALAHAAEDRDGKIPRRRAGHGDAVSLMLFTIDRLKEILADLETAGAEPSKATDGDLIVQLEQMAPRCRACAPQPAAKAKKSPSAGTLATRARACRCAPAKFRSTIWSAPSARRRGRKSQAPAEAAPAKRGEEDRRVRASAAAMTAKAA
jgi:two-component system chemotaxis sensor kinase CheA